MRRHSWRALLLAVALASLPVVAGADQASQPGSEAAAQLTAGRHHTCAVLAAAARCWGFGGDGRLGYGSEDSIGDGETPASAGPVDFGAGQTVRALSAGTAHTCALLDGGSVRCWGFGGDGRLGYANTTSIGDTTTPASAGPVSLGAGRTAVAVGAGGDHSCALLDDGSVRCWGYGFDGRLGYGATDRVGDDETPGSVAPVDLGAGRTATALSVGVDHNCAILDNGSVRCWGFGGSGQLGYGNAESIGDTETPGSVGPVDLGPGRTATAISAGGDHTCAILDNGAVRCWGFGGSGQLGYGNDSSIGDDETPGSVGPVDLGAGRTARAISAGGRHTCAILDDAGVRCWGSAALGQLGYANTTPIGVAQVPGALGPVDLGSGRTALAIAAGELHTCARLDDASVRCWGFGATGRLGYCDEANVGDDEPPSVRGPVDIGAGGGCGVTGGPPPPPPPPVAPPAPPAPPVAPAAPAAPGVAAADPFAAEAMRAQRLRRCLAAAARRPRAARRRARQICVQIHRRTPGRVRLVRARAISPTRVVLTFVASGSDRRNPPAARAYLVKQGRRSLRRLRDFERGQALCGGSCWFKGIAVGATLELTVTNLRPKTTYHYAVAARDNVSHRTGPRSRSIAVRTK